MAQQRRRRGKVPAQTRRLTRDEAAARGVSYSAKRRVKVGVKVGAKTRLYTDREVAQAKLGKSKEAAQKARTHVKERREGGGQIKSLSNMRKAQMMRELRRVRGRKVVIHFKGQWGGRYKADKDGDQWKSGDLIDADEAISHIDEYIEEADAGDSVAYGITIL